MTEGVGSLCWTFQEALTPASLEWNRLTWLQQLIDYPSALFAIINKSSWTYKGSTRNVTMATDAHPGRVQAEPSE